MSLAVGYIRVVALMRGRFETDRSLFESLMPTTRNLAMSQSNDWLTVEILPVLQPGYDSSD